MTNESTTELFLVLRSTEKPGMYEVQEKYDEKNRA